MATARSDGERLEGFRPRLRIPVSVCLIYLEIDNISSNKGKHLAVTKESGTAKHPSRTDFASSGESIKNVFKEAVKYRYMTPKPQRCMAFFRYSFEAMHDATNGSAMKSFSTNVLFILFRSLFVCCELVLCP